MRLDPVNPPLYDEVLGKDIELFDDIYQPKRFDEITYAKFNKFIAKYFVSKPPPLPPRRGDMMDIKIPIVDLRNGYRTTPNVILKKPATDLANSVVCGVPAFPVPIDQHEVRPESENVTNVFDISPSDDAGQLRKKPRKFNSNESSAFEVVHKTPPSFQISAILGTSVSDFNSFYSKTTGVISVTPLNTSTTPPNPSITPQKGAANSNSPAHSGQSLKLVNTTPDRQYQPDNNAVITSTSTTPESEPLKSETAPSTTTPLPQPPVLFKAVHVIPAGPLVPLTVIPQNIKPKLEGKEILTRSHKRVTRKSAKQKSKPIILKRSYINDSRERMKANRPRLRHEIGYESIQILESWFEKESYLSVDGRKVISKQTGLPEKTIMYWFQNKRRNIKMKSSAESIKC